LTKSFVLYTVLEVEGELVDCIYFANNECRAQPVVRGVSGVGDFYKPTAEEQKDFCKERSNFRACARLLAYQTHLRALGLEKEEHH
jgi:hypothetical protein